MAIRSIEAVRRTGACFGMAAALLPPDAVAETCIPPGVFTAAGFGVGTCAAFAAIAVFRVLYGWGVFIRRSPALRVSDAESAEPSGLPG